MTISPAVAPMPQPRRRKPREDGPTALYELYSARVDGSDWVKLNASLIIGGDVEDDYQIAPDSSRVVYRADQEVNNLYELYSAPLDGLRRRKSLTGRWRRMATWILSLSARMGGGRSILRTRAATGCTSYTGPTRRAQSRR